MTFDLCEGLLVVFELQGGKWTKAEPSELEVPLRFQENVGRDVKRQSAFLADDIIFVIIFFTVVIIVVVFVDPKSDVLLCDLLLFMTMKVNV